eukprot:Sdes_comp17842_c0_seq1m7113
MCVPPSLVAPAAHAQTSTGWLTVVALLVLIIELLVIQPLPVWVSFAGHLSLCISCLIPPTPRSSQSLVSPCLNYNCGTGGHCADVPSPNGPLANCVCAAGFINTNTLDKSTPCIPFVDPCSDPNACGAAAGVCSQSLTNPNLR